MLTTWLALNEAHPVPKPYLMLGTGSLQSTNLENAKRNLENNTRELEVLKDFTTITEVGECLALLTARRMQLKASQDKLLDHFCAMLSHWV